MPNHRNTILLGDCRERLRELARDGTVVNCCITSPPYGGGLRSYLPEVHPLKGQEIGLEPTPEQYVSNLVRVFRLVRDILADDGTLWIVIGDKRFGSGGPGSDADRQRREGKATPNYGFQSGHPSLKPKDIILLPYMLAKALRDDGWYLRQLIIWAKGVSGQSEVQDQIIRACGAEGIGPEATWRILESVEPYTGGCRPESAKDRFVESHETVLLLSKSPNYFFDLDAVKEPASEQYESRHPRSVWTITTRPYPGTHFATFPRELIWRMVRAGTSSYGHCSECGRGWVRTGNTWGEPCYCDLPPVPGLILDPFGGSGTTAQVAQEHGRDWIMIDIDESCQDLIKQRTAQPSLNIGVQ